MLVSHLLVSRKNEKEHPLIPSAHNPLNARVNNTIHVYQIARFEGFAATLS